MRRLRPLGSLLHVPTSRCVRNEHEDAKQEDEQRDDENLNERSVASQDIDFRTVVDDGSVPCANGWNHGQQRLRQRFVAAPLLSLIHI